MYLKYVIAIIIPAMAVYAQMSDCICSETKREPCRITISNLCQQVVHYGPCLSKNLTECTEYITTEDCSNGLCSVIVSSKGGEDIKSIPITNTITTTIAAEHTMESIDSPDKAMLIQTTLAATISNELFSTTFQNSSSSSPSTPKAHSDSIEAVEKNESVIASCGKEPCSPDDCQCTPWSEWTNCTSVCDETWRNSWANIENCSAVCGLGVKNRTRICTEAIGNGRTCAILELIETFEQAQCNSTVCEDFSRTVSLGALLGIVGGSVGGFIMVTIILYCLNRNDSSYSKYQPSGLQSNLGLLPQPNMSVIDDESDSACSGDGAESKEPYVEIPLGERVEAWRERMAVQRKMSQSEVIPMTETA